MGGIVARDDRRVNISATRAFDKHGYAAGRIAVDEHFGTHLDAPAHFSKSGWTVDQIPVERLYRPGVRIDVSAEAAGNPDYLVTPAHIRAFESSHGRIPEGAIAPSGVRISPNAGTAARERALEDSRALFENREK